MAIFFCSPAITWAQNISLSHTSSYENNEEGNAEVVAYDPETKQAYYTSSEHNSFSIVSLENPDELTLIKEVDLAPYGGGPNSIDTNGDVVAVAVENEDKQAAGNVVIFDKDGNHQKTIAAGALPDMLTFNHAGNLILVANEGEPNDDYSVDPEGSITIIDLATDETIHLDFKNYNEKRVSLQNKGIRIFGNNGTSSVAQDMEPEYITVSPDDLTAYVNCQENNALAVVDLSTFEMKDLLPLGYKDHTKGTPSMSLYNVNELVQEWPELGTPVYGGGQDPVMLGGFSGLFYDASSSNEENSIFYVIPDRGPNASTVKKAKVTPEVSQNLRPFKLPKYQSRIVKFTLNNITGAVTLDDQIMLTQADGTPISGKGNVPGVDEIPVTYSDPETEYNQVDYTDDNGIAYHALPFDPFGGDFEGILKDKEGNFWMCDEYRPAIYKFSADGVLIDRFIAEGTAALGDDPKEEGTYGSETLPAIYAKRRANRGFEAIAYDAEKDVIYAFIQSPMYNPDSSTKNNSDVIRILGVSATDGTPVEEYVYLLERNKDTGVSTSRVDKIGDAVYTGNGKFLVIERDSEGPDNPHGKKYIFEVSLTGATNVLNMTIARNDGTDGSTTLEEMTADQLFAAGVQAVHKNKVVNLPTIGYVGSDKAEGVALLPDGSIAVMNDNDFGLAGAGITDNSVLGIIAFDDNYSFDASNKDDEINITAHPTLGMYMPDAIASYDVDGMTYIVTANEGDSRDYDGYSEEVRVKDLMLDPTTYPDAATLQANENLGRLKTTTANGDYDGDGDIDQIYSYGARSFSIFDKYGNLVYDSANEFGLSTAENEPDLFNEDEGEKDNRSDDKGVEPEAVAIATIGDRTFAFIGLERQSAIITYDITNPFEPFFVDYYNNRSWTDGEVSGDVAPEIIKFIPSADSPDGKDRLLVGYEVSGSMALLNIDGIVSVSDEQLDAHFKLYPNPAIGTDRINSDKKISGTVFNAQGDAIMTLQGVNQIDISHLSTGVYILKSDLGTRRFLKL